MNTTSSNSYNPAGTPADVVAPQTPFKFEDEQQILQTLETARNEEQTKTTKRREFRRHRVNVQKLRDDKLLSADQTIIPDRTIEQNIKAEKVAYNDFMNKSPHILAFNDYMYPTANFDVLNTFATNLFRYPGWKKPWRKAIDARLVHGGVAMELVPAPSTPGLAKVEYIRREDLLIPAKTRDINSCMRVGRRYQWTKQQFKTFAQEFGFDELSAKKVEEHYKASGDFITVVKWFAKENGVVHIAWFADIAVGLTSYLKSPEPLKIGLMDVAPLTPEQLIAEQLGAQPGPPQFVHRPVSKYTIYLLTYQEEEDEEYLETQGRVALDIHTQEAITAVLSATVNGATRAAQLYPTVEGVPGDGIKTDSSHVLKPDCVYTGKYSLFQPPWPNAIALSIVQALSTRNAQASGQTDFASMSREDSAKRATELTLAKQEADELSSLGMSLWSEAQLDLYLDWWEIIKSGIVTKAVQIPEDLSNSGIDLASKSLRATMAADSYVVKKAETTQRRVQFYSLVQGTKFQEPYFETMITELFPEDVDKWKQSIAQSDMELQVLMLAFQLLQQTPPSQVSPENQQVFANLLTQMQQIIAAKTAPPNATGTNAQQKSPPPAGGNAPQMAGGPSNGFSV